MVPVTVLLGTQHGKIAVKDLLSLETSPWIDGRSKVICELPLSCGEVGVYTDLSDRIKPRPMCPLRGVGLAPGRADKSFGKGLSALDQHYNAMFLCALRMCPLREVARAPRDGDNEGCTPTWGPHRGVRPIPQS